MSLPAPPAPPAPPLPLAPPAPPFPPAPPVVQAAGAVSSIVSSASRPASQVLSQLRTSGAEVLCGQEVLARRGRYGPDAVSSHHAAMLPVLRHQLASPLLGLLFAAAVASYLVGERGDAVIIGVILALSVGLGFGNEYRAEKAADALHSQIRHEAS